VSLHEANRKTTFFLSTLLERSFMKSFKFDVNFASTCRAILGRLQQSNIRKARFVKNSLICWRANSVRIYPNGKKWRRAYLGLPGNFVEKYAEKLSS